MRNLPLHAALACLVAAHALICTPSARAATAFTEAVATGSVCQLSIPTTNTGVRPKATGFRNESETTGNFVICPLPIPNYTGHGFTQMVVGLYSLDGAARNVTCTAMTSWFGGGIVPKYSSKTVAVATTTSNDILVWDASDFGGTAGNWFMAMSVTCNLPPQTAIAVIQGYYNYDIGT